MPSTETVVISSPRMCVLHSCLLCNERASARVWVLCLIFISAITRWLRLLSIITPNCFQLQFYSRCFYWFMSVLVHACFQNLFFCFLEHPLGDNRQSETWWDQISLTKQVKSLSLQSNVNRVWFSWIIPPCFSSLFWLNAFSPFFAQSGLKTGSAFSRLEALQTVYVGAHFCDETYICISLC